MEVSMPIFPRLLLISAFLACAGSLAAQQVCRGFTVVMNSPEDKLTMAINGANDPAQQIQALDAYMQAQPNSNFLPCVDEYYAMAYLKQNNYAKVIEYGEKALAAHDQNILLLLNMAKAYVGSAQAVPEAFQVIMLAPGELRTETPNARPANATDAEWQKTLSDYQGEAKDIVAYMEYAFFSLLPRVTDANQRLQYLDQFTKTYADSSQQGRVDFQYFIAYKMLNNRAKADSYGEKTIAEDPNNVDALNLLAYDYGIGRTNPAKAALNSKLGLAHLTLGYVDFLESPRTHRIAPAIDQFKTAATLLGGNPDYQAQALFYLGNAYEFAYPPNHRAAAEALERAASLQTPWQGRARELLAKVRAAERR